MRFLELAKEDEKELQYIHCIHLQHLKYIESMIFLVCVCTAQLGGAGQGWAGPGEGMFKITVSAAAAGIRINKQRKAASWAPPGPASPDTGAA